MPIPDDLLHAAVRLAGDDQDMLARIEAIVDGPRRAPPPVRYGDPAWHKLPADDPRRTEATRVAAECWRDNCSPGQIAIDLAGDLLERDHELARRVREASWDVCRAMG